MANSTGDILLGVFNGKITRHKLPVDYYKGISEELMSQVEKGIGGAQGFASLADNLLLNAQAFAAAKTYQVVRNLETLKKSATRFQDFETVGRYAVAQYNGWAEAEVNTALQQTLQARQWQIIDEDKDLFPILRYSTIGDACAICRPLDGLMAAVNSPIWRKIYPCNHYNCYCIVTQQTAGAGLWDKNRVDTLVAESEKLMSPVFISNPGITQQLFTKDHPYFSTVLSTDKAFAKHNFGLPIK